MPKTFVLTKQSPLLQEDVDCNYCHTDLLLDDQVTACDRCESPHHSDCWEANGNQCATFGCVGGAGAVRRSPPPPATNAAPDRRTRRNTQRYTVAGQVRIQSNRRRLFGLLAFVAMIFYTIFFEAGASQNLVPPLATPPPTLMPVAATATVAAAFTNCGQVIGIKSTDCAALVNLYESTDGPNWRQQSRWLKSTRPCLWQGIRCKDGQVTHIRLPQNQLNGQLPPSLGNLTALAELVLSNNQIKGEMPPELGQLSSLRHINLTSNQLNGGIPPELGQLSNLIRLLVGNNNLSGEIPTELSQLTPLQSLDLSNNQLSGTISKTLACSPTLSSGDNVNIANNRLITSNIEVTSCLNVLDEDWAATQTVPPTNVQAIVASEMALRLSWTPILFSKGGGYYELFRSNDGGMTYTIIMKTSTKEESSLVLINELNGESENVYAVRSVTPAFNGQKNTLTSEFSEWVSVQIGSE